MDWNEYGYQTDTWTNSIFPTTFSNGFPWTKRAIFRFKYNGSLCGNIGLGTGSMQNISKAITQTNVEQYVLWYMASVVHNEFKGFVLMALV